jgi:hypothetical protein
MLKEELRCFLCRIKRNRVRMTLGEHPYFQSLFEQDPGRLGASCVVTC